MAIRLEFTLTFEDFLNAARLHARRTWWTRFCLLFQEFLAPLLGIAIGLYAVLRAVKGETGIPFIVMICAALYLVAFTNPRARLKQAWKQNGAGGEESWEFDDNHIRSRKSTGQSEWTWAVVSSFSEDDNIIMLNLSPGRSIVIPKRSCASDQIDELRELSLSMIV